MKATKEFYLVTRSVLVRFEFNEEVKRLDNHFEIIMIYNKENKLIKIY